MSSVDFLQNYLPKSVFSAVKGANDISNDALTELRVRKNGYILAVVGNKSLFLTENGRLKNNPDGCLTISPNEFDELFLKLCDYSVYSKTEQLKKGFVTLPNGARVGVAQTAVYDGGELEGVINPTALNIRIPQNIRGCSVDVLNKILKKQLPSVIVAGMPGSGKTTFLKDLAYQLSSGFCGEYKKVCIVDERLEFGDIGINCDVLPSFSKPQGIELAVKTLSPEMIICDEVATQNEVESILYAFSSGVSFALSVHIKHKDDLLKKPALQMLVASGEFSYVILLKDYTYKCDIIDITEEMYEACRNNCAYALNNRRGCVALPALKAKV